MAIEIVTKEDLQVLRQQLISDIRQLISGLPKPIEQNTWLKSDEVIKVLKVSHSTLQTLRLNGTLKFAKIGGNYYYDYQHIQKLLEEQTQQ
ncbi:MAG: helix-turn-helix domain-containing protein [Bacteroidetes bacterium]|nr:helix-turn-helix domain-containing protein [Bacteroidota bacterium]